MKKEKVKHNLLPYQRITSVFLLLSFTVFLFYTGSNSYQQITQAKFSAFLILCGGYVALMLLLMTEGLLIGSTSFPSLKSILLQSSWTQRFIVIYLVFSWLSAVLSDYWPVTFLGASRNEGILTITIYCLCFLLVSAFGRFEKWMLPVFGTAVTIFATLCILQLYGHNPLQLYPEGYNYFGAYIDYSGAFLGTIGNVDMVGAFLCVAIPVLWIALLRQKGPARLALLPPLLLSLFVLLKMSVLASFVGVFGGALLALPVVLPAPAKTKRAIGATALATLIVTAALLFLVDVGDGFFHELHEILHGRMEDSFGSGRIYIWKSVIEKIPEHLLFGYGPDTMSAAGIESFVRYDERLNVVLQASIDTAHNEYLNILFHQGALATLSYIAALITCAVKWIKYSSEDSVIAILGGAVLCYCIQAFFGISMCASAPFFWISFGLLESHCNSASRRRTKICGKS